MRLTLQPVRAGGRGPSLEAAPRAVARVGAARMWRALRPAAAACASAVAVRAPRRPSPRPQAQRRSEIEPPTAELPTCDEGRDNWRDARGQLAAAQTPDAGGSLSVLEYYVRPFPKSPKHHGVLRSALSASVHSCPTAHSGKGHPVQATTNKGRTSEVHRHVARGRASRVAESRGKTYPRQHAAARGRVRRLLDALRRAFHTYTY